MVRAERRRAPLAQGGATTAYRLLNGAADGLPGVTVDRFAQALVVNLYAPAAPQDEQALVGTLAGLPGTRTIYVKRRPRSARRLSAAQIAALAPPAPAWGPPMDEVSAREAGLTFLIRPGAGLGVGLFPDMRDMRARLRARAPARTVLNLFAYTCAFGVAAVAGGARRVLNLDASRPALRWGMENYALNGLAVDSYDFVYGDVFDWLGRFARRGQRFDVVIADPPSFSNVRGRHFAAAHNYGALAAACARVVAPGGLLLCCANEAGLSRRAFRSTCLRGAHSTGRRVRVLSYDREPPIDFPLLPGDEGHLKALWLAIGEPIADVQ